MSHTIVVYEDLTVSLPVEVTSLGGEAQDAAENAAFDAECQKVHGVPFAEFEKTCDEARAAIVNELAKKPEDRKPQVITAAEQKIAAALALRPKGPPPAGKE